MKRPNLITACVWGVVLGGAWGMGRWILDALDGRPLAWAVLLILLVGVFNMMGLLNFRAKFGGAWWWRMKREMRVQHIADCRKDLAKLEGRKGFVASAIRGFTRSEIERAEAKLAAADARAANDKEND